MSNDLIANADRHRVEPGPTTARSHGGRSRSADAHRGDRALEVGRARSFGVATGRPFADADEATAVASSCRAMLGRHVDVQALPDAVAVVLAAKVMDEAAGHTEFEAIEGQPRQSASRFDRVMRAALTQLRGATADVTWPDVEVPELVAHQILRDLGPYSVLRTAEQPDGNDTLRALFVAAVGGRGTDAASALADPVVAEQLWRLVPSASVKGALGAVAAAAAAVFSAADEPVVDLRDGAPTPAPRRA